MILKVTDRRTGEILFDYTGDILGTDGTATTQKDANDNHGSSTTIILTITGCVLKFCYADHHYQLTDITQHCDVLTDFDKQ